MKKRIEKDSLGSKKIHYNAYYGIESIRSKENFPISGLKPNKELIKAIAVVKIACTTANYKTKKLDRKKGFAIIKAGKEVLKGRFKDEFIVDPFQAGAGTSFNMNANEVIANRTLELLRKRKGDYETINPHDHVNMSQSTNDVFPTCIRISSLISTQKLINSLKNLEKTLYKKTKQFSNTIKSGRTHLQDALPITLGQEFSGYRYCIKKRIKKISFECENLKELNIGGTAIGTGLNASKKYALNALKEIEKLTKIKFKKSENYFEITQSMSDFCSLSSNLKNLAIELIRIANDLRLLSSGPKTGLNEIILPAVQQGSSIMPGKINPSIPEMLNMVCFQVIGNDTTICLAAQAGQLELNVMMPVIAHNLLQSIEILTNAINVFTNKCVKGIKANKQKCLEYAKKSTAIVTVLTPKIGYDKAAELAKEALKKDKTIIEVAKEKKILSEKEIKRIFDWKKLTKPQ